MLGGCAVLAAPSDLLASGLRQLDQVAHPQAVGRRDILGDDHDFIAVFQVICGEVFTARQLDVIQCKIDVALCVGTADVEIAEIGLEVSPGRLLRLGRLDGGGVHIGRFRDIIALHIMVGRNLLGNFQRQCRQARQRLALGPARRNQTGEIHPVLHGAADLAADILLGFLDTVLDDKPGENQVENDEQDHEQHTGFCRPSDQAFQTMDQNSHVMRLLRVLDRSLLHYTLIRYYVNFVNNPSRMRHNDRQIFGNMWSSRHTLKNKSI